ncbi:hypothetical protein FH063_000263 [Azospirillum argentinense]|uniref:Uncharacterized protein n=1 Tax=Azospirillum argentinense TaxID=2970906 RepID=A0A5B0L2A5_9PROT|nr:hypothetical protein FH063_000263 [Azospirillum argentinense]
MRGLRLCRTYLPRPSPSPALSGCQRHPPAAVSAGFQPAREALRATLSPEGRGL